MTQNDLNRSVAHSTGETVSEISRRGFLPIEDLDGCNRSCGVFGVEFGCSAELG